MKNNTLLSVKDIHVYYGELCAIRGVSLSVPDKNIVSILGPNGAGKSTILRAISGLVKVRAGKILFSNQEIANYRPEKLVRMGISYVPEEREIFLDLTVRENLMMGAFTVKDKQLIRKNLELVHRIFPILESKKSQVAGSMSGGEQQMLVIGRSLLSNAKLMLLDEPSLGLAPLLVKKIFQTIQKINKEGKTIVLVEQNANMAFKVAQYAYILGTGKVATEGAIKNLIKNENVRKIYLGITN